jgi:hypothetical protein
VHALLWYLTEGSETGLAAVSGERCID